MKTKFFVGWAKRSVSTNSQTQNGGHVADTPLPTLQVFLKKILIGLVKLYQLLLSPFLGGRCRFYPSCSSYAVEALQKHGALKGASLICKRVIKCHPWHEGGIDLVP